MCVSYSILFDWEAKLLVVVSEPKLGKNLGPIFCTCVVCHQVSDASGSMQVTVVKEENPFLQSDLLSDECFILDHGKNKIIFVWKGVAAVVPITCWWLVAKHCVESLLSIFTWSYLSLSGRNANPSERKEAMKTAEGFIQQMGYPANTQVHFLSTLTFSPKKKCCVPSRLGLIFSQTFYRKKV